MRRFWRKTIRRGGRTCGAIAEASRSSKAIDNRVIIKFCDENAVIASFRDKNDFVYCMTKMPWYVMIFFSLISHYVLSNSHYFLSIAILCDILETSRYQYFSRFFLFESISIGFKTFDLKKSQYQSRNFRIRLSLLSSTFGWPLFSFQFCRNLYKFCVIIHSNGRSLYCISFNSHLTQIEHFSVDQIWW